MNKYKSFEKPVQPDWRALLDNIQRKGTPKRVHHVELFHDPEIYQAIIDRFDLAKGLNRTDPHFERHLRIKFLRFMGYDSVQLSLPHDWRFYNAATADTAAMAREGGRTFQDEHTGPVTNWQEFEEYDWPDPNKPGLTEELEWYHQNLPDDMCIFAYTGHFAEFLTWIMGYETLCLAIYDQPDLVQAIADKLMAFFTADAKRLLQYERIRALWGSDDMGFKGGLLISPQDTRKYMVSGHVKLAKMAHDAGRLYFLHSCGKLTDIIPDLINDVHLDAKHSYEDTIEDVRQVKHTYGRHMAMLGGMDVDFMCRADEKAIRNRVRETLDICMPGGGYCLGTGNTVANYIPLENYLAMVDEGRLYA